MKLIHFDQVTRYSKALALLLLFSLPFEVYWLGFEYGKAISELKIASFPTPEPLCVVKTEYKQKQGWNVFMHRLSPVQIQYPKGWVVTSSFNTREDLAPYFGSSFVNLWKSGTNEIINVAYSQNTENLSVEEWSEELIKKEFERKPNQPKFTITNTPYRLINCVKTIRRSGENRNMELIFTKKTYLFLVTATKDVKESEFLEIIRTLNIGSVEDFPLWEQMQKEKAENVAMKEFPAKTGIENAGEEVTDFVSKVSDTAPLRIMLALPGDWEAYLKKTCDSGRGDLTGEGYSVDWGDGTDFPHEKTGCGLEHTYVVPGKYVIKARTYSFTDIIPKGGDGRTTTWATEATVTVKPSTVKNITKSYRLAPPVASIPSKNFPTILCPEICPFYASMDMDWCNGAITQEVKNSCKCWPDCR